MLHYKCDWLVGWSAVGFTDSAVAQHCLDGNTLCHWEWDNFDPTEYSVMTKYV